MNLAKLADFLGQGYTVERLLYKPIYLDEECIADPSGKYLSRPELFMALLLRAEAKGLQPMLVDTGDEWRCDFTATTLDPQDAETPLAALAAAVEALT